MGDRVLLDCGDVLIGGLEPIKVAGCGVESGADRMNVRVLKRGHQHPALKIDDLSCGSDIGLQFLVRPHKNNAPCADRDSLRPAARPVHFVDRAASKREIGCGFRRVRVIQ